MNADRESLSLEANPHIRIRVTPEDPQQVLDKLRAGLLREPREISPRFFYDDRGSILFERICEQPEYYQTRTENGILQQVAGRIADLTEAEELVEIGSGAAKKTRVLLDAMAERGRLTRFLPFDVSEGILRRAAEELIEEYNGLVVYGMVGDFTEHLDRVPLDRRSLCIFLGGTIGNFTEPAAGLFLGEVAALLPPGGYFLIGVDLIKEKGRLERAYNDAAGVTAAFNRNSLRVLNDLVDGDFDPESFAHRAFYNEADHRIEMWLDALHPQRARLPGLDLELGFGTGDSIRTEISVKYDPSRMGRMLGSTGFDIVETFSDPEALFALFLARRREE
jgi:L-histidine N-alpha-methyltransferase